jgi:NAD(P)H-dependent flavin oxidoreductase YrpB (nitropropane dioxygenase family)
MTLAHVLAAVMLSFGDPHPFAPAIKAAGRLLICQVQDMRHARAALDEGADIVVAQGTEAGGHGARRATMTLVPEVADLLAQRSPETLLVAAGGIADGRGLAAALMLGADGVLVGSRLWASPEALVHANCSVPHLARTVTERCASPPATSPAAPPGPPNSPDACCGTASPTAGPATRPNCEPGPMPCARLSPCHGSR